jgi:cellulose synthase/poly-beta-1,6-N-acetylglucosamine synthase-like glycosyltransferase
VSLAYDLILVRGAALHPPAAVADFDPASIDATSLPTYTVMVALYKEAEVLASLVENLKRINYPTDKLQVLLLLEADDTATIRAARALELPSHIRVVLVPVSQPRTKPKALNYGLSLASGELCTVYDAEDFPDPNQLLKAALRFNTADRKLLCLQCKLLYHNAHTNLLTQWFTAEYAKTFHLFLPGLNANRLVIPLGGTSNHFRTRQLIEIGQWDAYNVTEDADLGVRIARMGYRVEVLDSVTFEAANAVTHSWIRQRSRWIKGYMQTYLVHMRNPLALLRQLGLRRFAGFQMTFGVGPYLLLVNPLFWALTAVYFATRLAAIEALFPPLVMFIGVMSMLLGNVMSVYYMLVGAMIQREHRTVKYALLTPLYWVLMSVAAWRAFIQLLTRPHHWDKTMHRHVAVNHQDLVKHL